MNGIPFVSEGTASKPETNRPYIKSVDSDIVNKQIYVTIDLSGKVKNADGYQYQIYDGTKVLANKNSANTTCILKKCRLWDLPESVLILFKMVKKVIAGGLMKCVCLLLN